MAQLNWTYYSLSGLPYVIEMYHGEDSGHLMLVVNGQIFRILFSQLETKTHSFLIEQQLLELEIKKEVSGYEYKLAPKAMNENYVPPKTFDKHFWWALILLLVILNLVFYLSKSLLQLG